MRNDAVPTWSSFSILDSKPRGVPLSPHPDKAGIFRVYSHNPNGLSSKDDHADVKNVAKAIKAKGGLQETN
jgi:hypothetical protein